MKDITTTHVAARRIYLGPARWPNSYHCRPLSLRAMIKYSPYLVTIGLPPGIAAGNASGQVKDFLLLDLLNQGWFGTYHWHWNFQASKR